MLNWTEMDGSREKGEGGEGDMNGFHVCFD